MKKSHELLRTPKPPLCMGRGHGEAVTEGLCAGTAESRLPGERIAVPLRSSQGQGNLKETHRPLTLPVLVVPAGAAAIRIPALTMTARRETLEEKSNFRQNRSVIK